MQRLLLSVLVLFPASGWACSPPTEKMSAAEFVKWNEANPCGMVIDLEKYNKLREECLDLKTPAIHGQPVPGVPQPWVKPAPTAKMIEECNHEAYIASDLLANSKASKE